MDVQERSYYLMSFPWTVNGSVVNGAGCRIIDTTSMYLYRRRITLEERFKLWRRRAERRVHAELSLTPFFKKT